MIRAVYIRNALAILIAIFILAPFQISAATEDPAAPSATDITQTPEFASVPYQFKNEGIFGCTQVAGAAMSVGTFSAIGGVYVPVNDAAVTVNTGVLVYKECVLRPLLDRLREAATAGLFKKAVTGIQTGRDGNKQYVAQPGPELLQVSDKEFLQALTDGTLNALDPEFKSIVQTSLARDWYRKETRAPASILTCPFSGSPSDDTFGAILSLQYAACNPLGARNLAQDLINSRITAAQDYQRMEWDWGRGFYAVSDNAADPLQEKTLTPASVVQQSFQEILGSPVRQLESANDIGQMIGALFSGATTQIMTDNKGLAGLTQSVAGQPSYLDQVAKESSQGVVGAAVNAALAVLNPWRQNEASYLGSMNGISSSLTQTIARLRGAENQCWNLIISNPSGSHVCATALTKDNMCNAVVGPCTKDPNSDTITCSIGSETRVMPQTSCTVSTGGAPACTSDVKLKVATSTAFSQQVIDSQISPLATVAVANVQTSEKALKLIDQLIEGVTNTSSLNAQRISLQQLDSLVAQKALHNQYDAIRAGEQRKEVEVAMASLFTDTAKAWADSPDPVVGWCNVNNPGVIRAWIDRWRVK